MLGIPMFNENFTLSFFNKSVPYTCTCRLKLGLCRPKRTMSVNKEKTSYHAKKLSFKNNSQSNELLQSTTNT